MKTTTKTITGLSLAALLALTACGDGDDVDTSNGDENGSAENNGNGEEASGEVFEFEAPVTESNHGPYDEVTVQIPDELLENEPEYAENRVLESITIQAGDPQEAGQCAIHATFNYADGVEEKVGNADLITLGPPEDTPEDERVADSEMVAHQIPADERFGRLLNNDDRDGSNDRGFTEDNITDSVADVTCGSETVLFAFNSYEITNRAEEGFVEENPHYSDETTEALENSDDISMDTLAQVEAGVDSDGNITLYAPGVDGWEYDNNGNWVAR